MSAAYLTAILDTKNSKVLGYQIRGPGAPDPFGGGKLGRDRMVAVLIDFSADMKFSECVGCLMRSLTEGPFAVPWKQVVTHMKANGEWPDWVKEGT